MESQEGSSGSQLHVVMFPWLAFGHITPFVQLSNKLASHGVQISFLSAPVNIQRISSSLSSSPLIKIIPVHIPAVDGLPPGLGCTADMSPALADLLKVALDKMQPQIESLLIDLEPHIVFIDFVQHWFPSIASPLIRYQNFPFRSLRSCLRSLLLTNVSKQCENCLTLLLLKSCDEMEGPYLDYISKIYGKPVLLTGPLVPEPPIDKLEEKWEKWLQKFPAKSVVFCSFGSETFLQDEQIKELVLGLEQTGLPFIAVLNFVPDGGGDSNVKLKIAFPIGFAERVQDRGMVHTGWVQQQLILAHDSVGCYVCHAGLSSVIEAFMNDCQLVLLPQRGDQFLNSKLVSGDLEAGVQVTRDDEHGHFNEEDLCTSLLIMGNGKDFLLKKYIQDSFITNFVAEMKRIVN
ncbi:hypothetical protein MKW94_004570 [Papaver nudicaule]|uniref:Glycosyltransferase n=1 Tax=Papaver nudicaule TaxID=74823 RepID=A0AA41V5Q0_PAPNU|nr:hypothetical protein [Papaver nudicaule]